MRAVQRNAVGVAVILVVFAALTFFIRPTTLLGRVVESFDGIPKVLGEWNGRDLDSTSAAAALPNSSTLFRDYYDSSGRRANLTIVYGLDIADIHKPEYCFESQGWTQVQSKTFMLRPPKGPAHPAKIMLLNSRQGPTVCLYWYAGQGGARGDLAVQRFDAWKSAFMSRKVRPSALVRILVPVTVSEADAENVALSLAGYVDASVMRMVAKQPKIVRAGRTIGE
jgi:EpsI family protein